MEGKQFQNNNKQLLRSKGKAKADLEERIKVIKRKLKSKERGREKKIVERRAIEIKILKNLDQRR